MNKLLQSKKRGSAIPLSMVVVMILLAMGTGLLNLGLHSRIISIRTTSDIAAQCAADAGLTKALFEMNEKLKVTPWNDSDLPLETEISLPNCDAVFSYTVITGPSGYTLQSTGNSNQAQRTVSCTLQLQGVFDYGVLGVDTIYMKNNNLVDAYNSDTGNTDVKAKIGTLAVAPGSITFENNTIVDGDVFVGVGGDVGAVINDASATVTRNKYTLSEEISLPVITAPDTLSYKGAKDVQGTVVLSPADSGRYTGITFGNGGILQIDGGHVVLHVTGNIDMGNGSNIQIKNGSSLKLYVDGSMAGQPVNNAEMNNETGIPANFKLFLTGDSGQVIQFKNNADVYAAIYAPNADVIFKNNANFHGSIVARNITLKNNAKIYYDEALKDAVDTNEAVSFVVKNWQE